MVFFLFFGLFILLVTRCVCLCTHLHYVYISMLYICVCVHIYIVHNNIFHCDIFTHENNFSSPLFTPFDLFFISTCPPLYMRVRERGRERKRKKACTTGQWCTSRISELRKPRQEDEEFSVIFHYIAALITAVARRAWGSALCCVYSRCLLTVCCVDE